MLVTWRKYESSTPWNASVRRAFKDRKILTNLSRADKKEILLSCDPYNWMILGEFIAKQWTYAVRIFKKVSCKASQIASMTNRLSMNGDDKTI